MVSPDDIRVSAAIVTRNRPRSLKRTLESLRAQEVQPWEVVISDDSDDDYVEAIVELAEDFDCRYVRGPQRGLYANRNHVAKVCRGTHVRMIDDDHVFPPGHFAVCLEALRQDPGSVWTIAEKQPNTSHLHRPGEITPKGMTGDPDDPQNSRAISDGSIIYPQTIFDKGILFNESFRMGPVYLEFGDRLSYMGYRIREVRETYILHHNEDRSFTCDTLWLSARIYATLCHSFIYSGKISDITITSLYLIKRLLSYSPWTVFPALKKGIVQFWDRWEKISNSNA